MVGGWQITSAPHMRDRHYDAGFRSQVLEKGSRFEIIREKDALATNPTRPALGWNVSIPGVHGSLVGRKPAAVGPTRYRSP